MSVRSRSSAASDEIGGFIGPLELNEVLSDTIIEDRSPLEIDENRNLIPLVNFLMETLSDEGQTQASAALVLEQMATNNANWQDMICAAGGIPRLVMLLTNSKAEVQINAAAALAKLTFKNSRNKEEIRKANGINPLVDLLSDTNALVRANAAKALCMLAMNNVRNQEVIRLANGFTKLVKLLSDTNRSVLVYVAEVVRFAYRHQEKVLRCDSGSNRYFLVS